MRKLSIIAWLSAALLGGCGGSSGTITGAPATGGTGSTAPVASVVVQASANQISADGSDSAIITAVAKDASNNLVEGATVTFSASAGGLAITQATTDVNGVATATLSAQDAAAGTTITVTAATGGKSGNVAVQVVNTQQTVSLVTSLPQIPSDGSKSATITAVLRGSANQALSGVTVSFQASSGLLTVTQAVTDDNGEATATLNSGPGGQTNRRITVTATAGTSSNTVPVDVTGTKLTISGPLNLVQSGQPGTYTVSLTDSGNIGIPGQAITVASTAGNPIATSPVTTDSTGHGTIQLTAATAGTDTLTASALGLTATQSVAISNQSFVIMAPAANTKVNLNVPQVVTLVWKVGTVPQVGKTVTFSTTRGVLTAPTVTDGNGQATVTITSDNAGPAIITASGPSVSTQVSIDFIATQADTIAVQATPSTIPTEGQSTIYAVVRDPQDNLVEGQTVVFQLTDNTGGVLSVGSAVTDIQGKAQTVYTASSTPSASNGVTISASVPGSGALPGSTTLTVGGQTVFLSLGTGNTISPENDAQYSITYAVQAIDSAGNGISGVPITLTTLSLQYRKGLRVQGVSAWTTQVNATCESEDAIPANGILDAGEDLNTNQRLDPGTVASVSPGSVTTDTGGSALVKVLYPKDHADYVEVRLTATATVSGTQTNTSAEFWLPAAAVDFNTLTVPPPGPVSPYGVANVCSDKN